MRELDYTSLELERESKRTCDFCSNLYGEDNKSVRRIVTRKKNGKWVSNDVFCESCEEKYWNNELSKCERCGRLQTKHDIDFLSGKYVCCCIRYNENIEEKELPDLPYESSASRYERQINSLQEQLTTTEEELEIEREEVIKFQEKSKEWSERQKQELLDRIKELEGEVSRSNEQLRSLNLQDLLYKINFLEKEVGGLKAENASQKKVINKLKDLEDLEEALFEKTRPKKNQRKDWRAMFKDVVEANSNRNLTAQEWLDKKYPKEKRKNSEILNIDEKGLDGELKIEDCRFLKSVDCSGNSLTELFLINCPSLETVIASNNQLKKLSIANCPKIKYLYVYNNKLESLEFLNKLNSGNLLSLIINNNKFPAQDLSIFSRFINLEELIISNNPFTDSLMPLSFLNNLDKLVIENTQINSGLSYLPESLKTIFCNIPPLTELLKGFEDASGGYNYLFWREKKLSTFMEVD